jgi:predicted DNA-binding protein
MGLNNTIHHNSVGVIDLNGNGTKSVRMEADVWKQLDKYARSTGRKKRWVVSRAVEKYLEKKEEK